MASQNYTRSAGLLQEESEYFYCIICSHPQHSTRKCVAQHLIDKLVHSHRDFIIHFHPNSDHVSLIPLEKKLFEQILDETSELTKLVTKIPDSVEMLLVTKSGSSYVLNDTDLEKAYDIVNKISKSKIKRTIDIGDFDNKENDEVSVCEDLISLQSDKKCCSTHDNSDNKKRKVNTSFLVLYFCKRLKHRKSVKCKPPNDEDFSVAEKHKNVTARSRKQARNKNIKKRKSWHEGDNKLKFTVCTDSADDSNLRENHLLEDKTVSVSPLKVSKNGKYSPQLIKHLRDVTNLPLDERPWGVTILVYPSRKGKSSKSAQRRSRTHNSQAQEGIPDQYPTQASDAAAANLSLPTRELVQTSSGSIFQSFTGSAPSPTTNLMVSVDSERSLVNRIRGQLPQSRFSQPEQPPRHPQYADQPSRQRSFSNWPTSSGQDPSRMSIYGFFYTGRFDLIRCFHCGIGLKDWAPADEPLFEHIKHSPECQFLKTLLGQDLLNAYRDNLLANQLRQGTGSSETSTGTAGASSGRIRNPQYSDLEARSKSFDKWPASAMQRPQTLADAGLFYTGFNDLCRCFTCDGGLQRWDADDDPWIEHARWFPHCAYVRQIKGQSYINMVQEAAAQAREEEEDPAVVYPPPGRRQGRGPIEQGMAELGLHDTEPLNTVEAQRVIGMGYSRRAVLLAIHEFSGQAHGERNDYTAADLVRILTDRQDRGEALPPDSPEDRAPSGILLAENMDPEEENRRLKGILKCLQCEERDTNILFLPCTHHRLCDECAETAVICPVCGRKIDEKIKTFMS